MDIHPNIIDAIHKDYSPVMDDRYGKLYLNVSEVASCCTNIRLPTNRYPYSMYQHARTKKHIKTLIAENKHRRNVLHELSQYLYKTYPWLKQTDYYFRTAEDIVYKYDWEKDDWKAIFKNDMLILAATIAI